MRKPLSCLLVGIWLVSAACRLGAGSPSSPDAETLPPATTAVEGLPPRRLERLKRGVNLPFWFWSQLSLDEVRTRFGDADLALLARLGFTYVRLPFDMDFFYDASRPDLLDPAALAVFDEQLARLLGYGLAVSVDFHSTPWVSAAQSDYSAGLEDPGRQVLYLAFWKSLAAHLSRTDPERVFLEVMNEPGFWDDPAQWYALQRQVAAAIRSQAPHHTLLLTSAKSSWLTEFVEMQPVDDANVVYNFHFYEPFAFTHQGADWAVEVVQPLRRVPYPADPQAVAPLLADLPAASAEFLRQYGEERWDAAAIRRRVQQAAEWGERHAVAVICNEFGAFKPYAAAGDRLCWHRDVRLAFEQYGIGWALFEYESDFGLVERSEGESVLDAALAEALGLALK